MARRLPANPLDEIPANPLDGDRVEADFIPARCDEPCFQTYRFAQSKESIEVLRVTRSTLLRERGQPRDSEQLISVPGYLGPKPGSEVIVYDAEKVPPGEVPAGALAELNRILLERGSLVDEKTCERPCLCSLAGVEPTNTGQGNFRIVEYVDYEERVYGTFRGVLRAGSVPPVSQIINFETRKPIRFDPETDLLDL